MNDNIKKLLKDKKIGEDDSKNFENDVQKSTDENISLIEKILIEKRKRNFNFMNKINHIAIIMDGNGRWGKKKAKNKKFWTSKRR